MMDHNYTKEYITSLCKKHKIREVPSIIGWSYAKLYNYVKKHKIPYTTVYNKSPKKPIKQHISYPHLLPDPPKEPIKRWPGVQRVSLYKELN